MSARTVVIVGGGTGGIVAARRLRGRLDAADRVVLVAREPVHRFAPSFLWVLTGARQPDRICIDIRRLRARGVEVIEAEAETIDAGTRTLRTSSGEVTYDRLVLAPGAELVPEAVPGLVENAHNLYALDGATQAAGALRDFAGGRIVVVVSRLPYKCPAAPFEAAFLVEALLRERGIRERSTLAVYTPEPQPMPVTGPAVGEAVKELLRARGIEFHPNETLERIERAPRELVFESGGRVGYDLVLAVPPHGAPRLSRASGLGGETGFIPVDRATLATSVEGISAIGDVTTIPIAGGKPLPKAGVFAHAQAEVVARRVADELAGRRPLATFDGEGVCFLELGDGRAAYATGDFYAEGAANVTLRRPGRRWHLAKVAFEQYWLRRWLAPI